MQCHLCGQWFRWIGGTHLARRHDWTIEEYREAFHLLQRTSTAAHGFSQQRREQLKQRVDAGELVPLGPDRPPTPRERVAGPQRMPHWRSLAARRPDLAAQLHPARNGELSAQHIAMHSTTPCGGSAGAAATNGEQPRGIGVTSRRVGAPSAQDPRADRHGAAEPAHWPPARICSPSCTPLSIPGSISHGSPPRATRSSGGCARRAATAGRRPRRFEPAARGALTAPWRAIGRRRT